MASSTYKRVVGEAVGGLAAELVLRTVDRTLHKMVTNQQIQSWTFDGKSVVPRVD